MDLSDVNFHLSTHRVVYKNDKEKGIECYAGDNFSGGWAQGDSYNSYIGMRHYV